MRIWLLIIAWIIFLGALTYVATHRVKEPQVPMVQASSVTIGKEADANLLFVPCPLTPRNLPARQEITA